MHVVVNAERVSHLYVVCMIFTSFIKLSMISIARGVTNIYQEIDQNVSQLLFRTNLACLCWSGLRRELEVWHAQVSAITSYKTCLKYPVAVMLSSPKPFFPSSSLEFSEESLPE